MAKSRKKIEAAKRALDADSVIAIRNIADSLNLVPLPDSVKERFSPQLGKMVVGLNKKADSLQKAIDHAAKSGEREVAKAERNKTRKVNIEAKIAKLKKQLEKI